MGKRVRGIEPLVAKVGIDIPVYRVRAALGHHVDIAAKSAPELSLASRSHHLELIHHVEAVEDAAQPRSIVVRRKAVHDEVVRKIPLATDRNALAWNRRRLGKELVARSVGRRDAWNEQRQVEEIASVQGQRFNLALHDRARDLRTTGLENGGVAGHDQTGFGGGDSEGDGQLKSGAYGQRHSAGDLSKPELVDSNLVRPNLEVGKPEASVAIGFDAVGQVRVELTNRDLRALNNGA